MAKPFDFSTALMVPQQGPKAKARADQAAIEKRRRELIDEKQTMDARKEDQVLANVRRQSYANIDQMQFAPQNPIQYKNTVPAVELSQAPLQPGTETAVGGPEDKGSYATDLLRQLESAKGQPAPDKPTITQPTQAPTGDGYAANILKQIGSTPAAAPRNPAIDDATMQAFAAQYDYSKPGLANRMREYPKKDNPAWFITDDDPNKAQILVYRPVPGKTGNSFDDNFVAVPLSSMRDGKFYVDGQPTSPVKKGAPKPTGAQAWAAANVNSTTFGNADKLKGAIAAATGGNYDDTVAQTRDFMKRAREAEPGASAVGDATGFIGPGVAIAKPVGMIAKPFVQAAQRVGPTLGFAAKTVEAGLQGLAGGAAYGYTAGAENKAIDEGRASPDLLAPERADAAVESGAMGAGFGAAMPALGVALRPIANAAGGLGARLIEPFMPGATAAHNSNIATQAVRRSLERAGILTVDDFVKRAARYQGKPAMVGEVAGQDALNSLVALTRMKGTTAEKAAAILEDRVQGMPGRMLKDIADETGLKPEEVLASVDEMVKVGRAKAAPAYDKAEQAPFAETANLERIVRDAPILQGLMRKAENRVQNQAVAQIGQADQMPPLKVYDELKQLVDEEINKRIVNGQGISDIQGVRDALVRELDTISAQAATGSEAAPLTESLYAKARELGGDAPKVEEGLRKGKTILAQNSDEVVRDIQKLKGEQLTATQIGVIRKIVKDVESGNLSPKRIKSPLFQKNLREVLGNDAAEGIIRKFSVEADLLKKGNRIDPNQNSVTGTVLNAPVSKMGDMAVNAASQLARGNVVGATIDAAKEGINSLRRLGFSENQLNAIGDILTNQNMDEAAGRLFPRGPGGAPPVIPPPVPPAGKLRENTPPPPTRTIPPRGPDNKLSNLSPGDRIATINARHPPAGPNLPLPYWDAATAIKRNGGDRAAATAELQNYADYLRKTKSDPAMIENVDRTIKAVDAVDPVDFDDAAFNASMKGRIEAGGTAAMEQGAKPAATSARSSVTPLKPGATGADGEWYTKPLTKAEELTALAIQRPLYHKTAAQFDSFKGPTFFSTDPNVNLARHNTIDAQSGNPKSGVITIQAVARKGLNRIPAPEYRKLIESGKLDSQFPREITPEQAQYLSELGYDYATAGTEVVIFDPKNIRRMDRPQSAPTPLKPAPKPPTRKN